MKVGQQMASAHRFKNESRSESDWCAAYTRHQHERVVAEHLEGKGFDVFLPLYRSVRRWSDRTKFVLLPLFPGYVFFRGGPDRRLSILETPGVHMILSSGNQFAHIPESEITAVRRLISGSRTIAPHPFLHCGDRVRIKHGPLEGIEGFLIRMKNECRLVLSVEMLSQSISVEVDVSDIEGAPASRHVAESQAAILCHLTGDVLEHVAPGPTC